MKKLFYFILLFFITFVSCNNVEEKDIKEIVVDIDNNKNVPFVNIENIIPLSNDSLIGTVNFFDVYKKDFMC